MKYMKFLEDSNLWKEQFEKNIKGKGNTEGDYFVINHTGRGENVDYIPEVKENIIMAKAKIRNNRTKTYKRKGKVVKTHSKRKIHRRKKAAVKRNKKTSIRKRNKRRKQTI